MSTLIERLEADVCGAEFMERKRVPVERGHLSDLLKVARAAETVSDVGCVEEPGKPCGACDWCRLRAALAPLLREEGS